MNIPSTAGRLFFAGGDFGDVEGVILHAAVGVEHIGVNEAAQRADLAVGETAEMKLAVFFERYFGLA